MVTATRRMILAAILALAWTIASPARAELPFAETMIEVEFTFAGTPLEAVAERLTPVVENNLGAAPGLGFIVSWSRAGQVRLVLKFKPGIGESAALAGVRRQIAQALAQLPPAGGEPAIRAVPPERQPVAYVAFIGDRFSLGDVTRIVEPQVRERLQTAVGVEGIRLYGSRREIGRVRLDRDRLAAYGLSEEAVRAALAQNGIEASPAPDGDAPGLTLRNRFEPESVGQIVVKTVNGVPVRLRDIAQIERSHMHDGVVVRYDGAIGVLLEVAKRSEIGMAEAARALAAALPETFIRLPGGLSHKTGFSCERCVSAARR
jgi:multidrug efflux pump